LFSRHPTEHTVLLRSLTSWNIYCHDSDEEGTSSWDLPQTVCPQPDWQVHRQLLWQERSQGHRTSTHVWLSWGVVSD
jgi:hypothetical protein